MAYIADSNDPNAQTQQAPGATNQMPQTSTGGGGMSANSVAGSPQGSAAVPNTTQAPPVQDLKAYLTANAPQSVQMGQNIAGNLNQTANQVTGDINAAQADVNNQVQAQNIAPNAGLVNSAASNPSGFVQNPNDVAAFQQQANAEYKGPASFETTDYAPKLSGEVSNAQQQAPDITKQGGVLQLARSQEQNPTTGMSNLDALLLQESPGALKPVQDAIPNITNLGSYLSNVQGGVNQNISTAQANDAAAKQGVQDKFLTGTNAVVPAFQNELNQKLQDASGKVSQYNTGVNNLTTALNNAKPQLSNFENSVKNYNDSLQHDLQLMTQQGRQNNNPFSATPILSLGGMQNIPGVQSPPELNQVANQEDLSKELALQQLLGDGFTPGFTNLSNTPFKDPASIPTIQNLINPELASVKDQIGSLNPNVQTDDGSHLSQPVSDAYKALLAYLGEQDPTVDYGNGNGVVTGGGTTYTNPVTGQPSIAY